MDARKGGDRTNRSGAAQDRKQQAQALAFEIWCKVVDNLGDAGVCWRLARQLAGQFRCAVRLWIDAPEVLGSIAPQTGLGASTEGVSVRRWPEIDAADGTPTQLDPTRRTVHVSAFGVELPPAVRRTLSPTQPAPPSGRPLWINLEYLSAEDWVEGCHGLASTRPQDGAVEHFFYPGFTAATGGLLRESGLAAARAAFLAADGGRDWLAARGLAPAPGERLISMFCYPDAPLAQWLALVAAGDQPTRVLVPERVAPQALAQIFGELPPTGAPRRLGALTLQRFPLLPQDDYDRLLWCCDLNFVRGEDSWIRAHWAQRPFVWQPYPQDASTRRLKLDAFLARMLAEAPQLAPAAALMRTWCGAGASAAALEVEAPQGTAGADALADAWACFSAALPELGPACAHWSEHLAAQPDLATRLVSNCIDRL